MLQAIHNESTLTKKRGRFARPLAPYLISVFAILTVSGIVLTLVLVIVLTIFRIVLASVLAVSGIILAVVHLVLVLVHIIVIFRHVKYLLSCSQQIAASLTTTLVWFQTKKLFTKFIF